MPQIIRENGGYFSAMLAATIPIGWFDLAAFLLGRVVIFTVISAPPTVIPAQAGIYPLRFPIIPISTVIPAQAGIYTLRFPIIPIFPVIPAQAGIYTLRCTPVFAGATDPRLNHPKGNITSRQGRVSVQAV